MYRQDKTRQDNIYIGRGQLFLNSVEKIDKIILDKTRLCDILVLDEDIRASPAPDGREEGKMRIKYTKTNDGKNIRITGTSSGGRTASRICANISDRRGWTDETMKKDIRKELRCSI